MKILNPISQKSPISSLRFKRRNEFDKFLKFIKVETKNLKGEKEPDGKGVNKILSTVVKGGIGLFSIATLFARDSKETDFSKLLDFSVGRRDITTKPDPVAAGTSLKNFQQRQVERSRIKRKRPFLRSKNLVKPERFGKLGRFNRFNIFKLARRGVTRDFATRIKEAKTDPKKAESLKKINPTRSRVTFSQNVDADLIKAEKEIVKKFFRGQNRSTKIIDPILRKINESIEFGNLEDGFDASKFFRGSNKSASNFGFDLLEKSLQGATPEQIDDLITQRKIKQSVQRSKKIFGPEFERFTQGKVFKDPTSRLGVKTTSVISVNPLENRGRGGLARFFKDNFGSNKKLTRQNPLSGLRKILPRGIGTKLGMFASNPIVKAGLFFLDLYNAVQSGRNVFNLKDNLVTSLIDLGIAINNAVNADDPSKLKLFIGESSDQRRRLFQMRRNEEILKLKNAQNNQANNTVLIPMNTGNGQEGTPSNIPNPNPSSSSIAFNTDRVNIGDMVFLSKLSVG